MDEPASTPWHARSTDEVASQLQTHAHRGLSEAEARERLAAHGPNALDEVRTTSWVTMLWRQVTEPLVVVLVVAAIVSAWVGEPSDSLTIVAILVLNTTLGFVQEFRADRAIAALREMLVPHCRVIREGQPHEIDARDLVPGDLVALQDGDRIPADLRLVRAHDLHVDESALTGESLPVRKQPAPTEADAPLAEHTGMLHAGTVVTHGTGHGLVVATGQGTAFGRIATLTGAIAGDTTPLQRRLAVLGRQLGVLAIGVSVALAVLGVLTGRPLEEMALTAISLAVAVVPEGLPAVVTVTLALGIRKMVRHGVLLRRLSAAEALGTSTVICTDKTGTLTANAMTVVGLWLEAGPVAVSGAGYEPDGTLVRDDTRLLPEALPGDVAALVDTAARCHHAAIERDEAGHMRPLGDPTEVALVVLAAKAGRHDTSDEVVHEHPFSSARKRMSVVVLEAGVRRVHAKGAPEVVVDRCTHLRCGAEVVPLDPETRARVEQARRDAAHDGLRILALASRDLPDDVDATDADVVERDLTLLGLALIQDPPRPEVAEAVEQAHHAGLRILVITGDAGETAAAIARQIGIEVDAPIAGSDLPVDDPERLLALLRGDAVVSRATPEHKLRIVEALQQDGAVVAMTGDGVNDAPALKRADVGVAMGLRGTDVAKGAADVVLTDDHFASIVHGVKEGRRQHGAIVRFVRYLLSSNAGEVLALAGGMVLGGPMVLLPVQILWMNLVTDGLTALTLGLERSEPDLMDLPPRPPDAPLLGRDAWLQIAAMGSWLGFAAVFLYASRLGDGSPEAVLHAQTTAFTGLVVLEKINVFNFRSLRLPLHDIGWLANGWLLAAVAATMGLQVLAVYVPALQSVLHTTPLGWEDWRDILAFGVPLFLVPEGFKRWRRPRRGLRDRPGPGPGYASAS